MDNDDHSTDQHFRRLRDLNQELTCHIQSRILRREFRRAGASVRGNVLITGHKESFDIAAGCSFYASPGSSVLSAGEPLLLRALTREAIIVFGENSGVTSSTIVASKCIRIGRDCLIGCGCLIIDSDFHGTVATPRTIRGSNTAKSGRVDIGDRCFVGARSIILKGVSIPDDTVIPAGSTVIHDPSSGFRLV